MSELTDTQLSEAHYVRGGGEVCEKPFNAINGREKAGKGSRIRSLSCFLHQVALLEQDWVGTAGDSRAGQ